MEFEDRKNRSDAKRKITKWNLRIEKIDPMQKEKSQIIRPHSYIINPPFKIWDSHKIKKLYPNVYTTN